MAMLQRALFLSDPQLAVVLLVIRFTGWAGIAPVELALTGSGLG
jgi:hypothetical protein